MILFKSLENFFEHQQVFFMCWCVNEQIVNVYQNVFDIEQHSLISLWKLAGQPSRPIGEVTHANCPLPGIVKAVRSWEFSWSFICQNPEVKSSVEKIVEFARPMSPMHSVISFMLYLSMCEWLFRALKSWTMHKPWPCFLGTQKGVNCKVMFFCGEDPGYENPLL